MPVTKTIEVSPEEAKRLPPEICALLSFRINKDRNEFLHRFMNMVLQEWKEDYITCNRVIEQLYNNHHHRPTSRAAVLGIMNTWVRKGLLEKGRNKHFIHEGKDYITMTYKINKDKVANTFKNNPHPTTKTLRHTGY